VPPALIAEAYSFVGDADIDYYRYTSPDFMAREFTHMWARTWQWAAREEHIPEGDYITYDIGPCPSSSCAAMTGKSAPIAMPAFTGAHSSSGPIPTAMRWNCAARSTAGAGHWRASFRIFRAAGISRM
jgi:hypothetical protein